MGVKAPAVRRTDSLYAQLGGKAAVAAVVDRFYEKMLADPDIRPLLAKANLGSLKQRQAQFLTQTLGGPGDAKNRVTAPAHAHLLTQARHVERATTHLALALSEMNMAPDLVDGVMEHTSYETDGATGAALGAGFGSDSGAGDAADEREREDMLGQLAAISKSQAVIEFEMDGTIVNANENFLGAMGYTLGEIKGKHYGIFVEDTYRNSADYREFWAKLGRGEYQTGEYKRLGKGGREVWIQASYNPILDSNGKAFKVVKYATDITAQKITNADYAGQISAIGKSQAVIEFRMDGTIVNANDNFLKTMGYALDEIKGKHHGMFADDAYRASAEYREFWAKLNRGEYQTGEYRRLGKGGREIWIQASYNPILDLNGKPFKVVKYASDITAQKNTNADYAGQISAISKSQAVIEFRMDGTIVQANENFLRAMGYMQDEIKGKHHGIFVEENYRNSAEYREFWANLNRGEYQAGEYKRIGKGGREIWIQASYNPILDLNGKPFKVVKYASDITPQKAAAEELRRKVDAMLIAVSAASKGDLPRRSTSPGRTPSDRWDKACRNYSATCAPASARSGRPPPRFRHHPANSPPSASR
jgi:PAS domain S-box-containing protein